MALARIITRSEACARELSQDLLGRGYVVEVFAPDEIPDHTADLELRVETSDGKKLTANVKVQHGERSASLDFVHHLKARVAEVSRPEWQQALNVRGTNRAAAVANAARAKEESKLPANALSLAAPQDRVALEVIAGIPLRPVPDTGLVTNATTRPHPVELGPLVSQPPKTVVASSIVRPAIGGHTSLHTRGNRSEGWFWRAALGFAAVVLLALVAGFGISRRPVVFVGGASPEISANAPTQVAAASADVALWNFTGPAENTVRDTGSEVKSERGRNVMARQTPSTATRGTASEAIGKSVGDLIARDTVVYLDDRYKPAPKTKPSNQLARQQPSSRKRGGVIASNSVTYLNDKPTSKPK
jgi:hypothetical protein